ncbi:hypothetical protein DQ04_07761010 [Trypanosoma grayi]|uniref:hypothetical protein n=1 Tax=Trypanosoma grayi TaxID=71804 RepID=UPI0004F405D8|nr:hypothetical protein DQ04_07761010 [Trypanosoma grayi]KEG08197.1 hypothetical protein DQ04_07761010 [Trypanosoma grayi]
MMRMMVHHPLCVFALVLCWASYCVTAAATEGGVVDSLPAAAAEGIEARMAEEEADVKEKEGVLGRAKRGELAARGAQAALQMAKEAAMKARQAVEEANVNADAANRVATKLCRQLQCLEVLSAHW